MAVIQDQDLLSLSRGVVMSDVLFSFVKKTVTKKLGRSFEKLDLATFKTIAKALGLDVAKRIKDQPQFELLLFNITFLGGHAEAQFFIRARHIEAEWGKQKIFFTALKEILGFDGYIINTAENGWCVNVVLKGSYLPVQIGTIENAQRVYVAIKEIKKLASPHD